MLILSNKSVLVAVSPVFADHLGPSVKSVVSSVSLPVRHLVSHSFATAEALATADVCLVTLLVAP
jgi:hypothetical protein